MSEGNLRKGLNFLARYDLIPNERECPGCRGLMSLQKDSSAKHDRFYWKCGDCRKKGTYHKIPLRKGSFFEGTRLTIQQILFLAADWIESPNKRIEDTAKLFNINKNTVSEVQEWFRNLCQQWWTRTIEENGGAKLGGKGKTVEIDETAMFRAKYNKGSMLGRPTLWVFGLLERKTNNLIDHIKNDKVVPLNSVNRFS